jgi:hypothetical protein
MGPQGELGSSLRALYYGRGVHFSERRGHIPAPGSVFLYKRHTRRV